MNKDYSNRLIQIIAVTVLSVVIIVASVLIIIYPVESDYSPLDNELIASFNLVTISVEDVGDYYIVERDVSGLGYSYIEHKYSVILDDENTTERTFRSDRVNQITIIKSEETPRLDIYRDYSSYHGYYEDVSVYLEAVLKSEEDGIFINNIVKVNSFGANRAIKYNYIFYIPDEEILRIVS